MFNSIRILFLLVLVFLGTVLLLGSQQVFAEEVQDASSLTKAANEAVNLDDNITAQDLGINEPKLLPSHPLYFIKNLKRGIWSFFTRDPIKKAELNLKFANERLVEIKKMVASDKSEKSLQALEKYQKEIERLEKRTERIKPKNKNKLKFKQFLRKLVDNSIKQQKLLDELEEQLPSQYYQPIKRTKKAALEKVVESSLKTASTEEFGSILEKTLEQQKGSNLKHIRNLEILKRVEEQAPEEAKEAIRKAQSNVLKRFRREIIKMPKEKKPIIEKYIENVNGNKARQLEILSELEDKEMSSSDYEMIKQAKKKAIERIRMRLKKLKDDRAKEEYLKPLEKGGIEELKAMEELKENVTSSSEIMPYIIKAKKRAMGEFQKNLEQMKSEREKAEFLNKIEKKADIKMLDVLEEIRKAAPPRKRALLEEAKKRARQGIEKQDKATKMKKALKHVK